MFFNRKRMIGVTCSVMFVTSAAALPMSAHAGFLGKITKAAIYPVKKLGSNTSVDTHRVLQKNSVEKAPASSQTGQKVIVKPDGNTKPLN